MRSINCWQTWAGVVYNHYISKNIIDPQHILEMTQGDDEGGHGSMDLQENLRRAEKANVEVPSGDRTGLMTLGE